MDVRIDVHPINAVFWRVFIVLFELIDNSLVVSSKMHLRLFRLITKVHCEHGSLDYVIILELIYEYVNFFT